MDLCPKTYLVGNILQYFGADYIPEFAAMCTLGVVVVVSHIQRIGCQPEKNYFTRWPIPLVVC